MGVTDCDNMLMLVATSNKMSEKERDTIMPLIMRGFKVGPHCFSSLFGIQGRAFLSWKVRCWEDVWLEIVESKGQCWENFVHCIRTERTKADCVLPLRFRISVFGERLVFFLFFFNEVMVQIYLCWCLMLIPFCLWLALCGCVWVWCVWLCGTVNAVLRSTNFRCLLYVKV